MCANIMCMNTDQSNANTANMSDKMHRMLADIVWLHEQGEGLKLGNVYTRHLNTLRALLNRGLIEIQRLPRTFVQGTPWNEDQYIPTQAGLDFVADQRDRKDAADKQFKLSYVNGQPSKVVSGAQLAQFSGFAGVFKLEVGEAAPAGRYQSAGYKRIERIA